MLGAINPIGSGYEYRHHLREIYEKASLDSFLKDKAGYNKHGGELAGNAVPAVALGGKGVKLVKDKLGLNEKSNTSLVSSNRKKHILYGDQTGGGHKFALSRVFNGKSKFPIFWSENKIINHISDIATDPNLTWVQQTGQSGSFFTKSGKPARFYVDGIRDNVKIRVIIEPYGQGIISAYPIK